MIRAGVMVLLVLSSWCIVVGQLTTDIKLDQVGYLPGAPKLAFVVSTHNASQFSVRRVKDNSEVFSGKLLPAVTDADSADSVVTADFSPLNGPGKYYLDVPGVGKSWTFAIAPNVYSRSFYLTMRSFYGQRCGTAVDLGSEFPGYKHGACHLTGAYHATSGKTGPRLSAKGWHDAGDYGRYIVNSGISTGQLLWAWEMFGAQLKSLSLNIPESQNKIPDVLDEIRWNLDWMLTMQDTDGGVWHKQTSERFADFVMPENDPLVSYVIGTGKEPFKSTCATADFASVMALAARIYEPFDKAYADSCLAAAEKAWSWLEKNPAVTFRNSGNILTGDYGDRDCRDEILWSAAELWRTTRGDVFKNYFLSHYSEQLTSISASGPPSWPRVGALALWSYALEAGVADETSRGIRDTSVKAADEIVNRTQTNGYRVSLTTRDYVWGSNGIAANYGVQLLVANAMKPDIRYVQTAADNLHYLLGRNTFSLSWVTQLGEHPFRHPHHRPSQADNNSEPWPGLLSGGPNQYRQDPAMPRLGKLQPAKMYLDDWESYATNENCLNWNAPLVFLMAGLLEK